MSPRIEATLEGIIYAGLLNYTKHLKLAATITFTFLHQVQPTWFQFTLGLKQSLQVSFIYLMKHTNTLFITFRVCYIQSNGWVGFLFPFCTGMQCTSRWHSTPFWPYTQNQKKQEDFFLNLQGCLYDTHRGHSLVSLQTQCLFSKVKQLAF